MDTALITKLIIQIALISCMALINDLIIFESLANVNIYFRKAVKVCIRSTQNCEIRLELLIMK